LSDSLAAPQTIAPLPRVCAQLAELTAQQATDAAQLSRLIQSDPVLAGEIMRVANSPALRPRAAIVSLQQAVSWLGVAEVRNIGMAVMLKGEVFVAPGHEPESEELWREAWLAGLWAKEIARGRRKHVESAFLAALMHRTGAALALKILSQFEAEQRTVMDARTFA
jgi:HD-like signal output (HDOD) protein